MHVIDARFGLVNILQGVVLPRNPRIGSVRKWVYWKRFDIATLDQIIEGLRGLLLIHGVGVDRRAERPQIFAQHGLACVAYALHVHGDSNRGKNADDDHHDHQFDQSESTLSLASRPRWTGYGIYEATQLAVPIAFLKFSRVDESEADWLGLQYMYKAGYDPQAFIQFFEKISALEKHKPGTLSKVFSDHPQTPDRIGRSEEEIATIMPARPDYIVSTSEFDDVKARLARLENKRKLNDKKDGNRPTLRRVGGGNNDPADPNNPSNSDDRPTLSRRD